MHHTKDPIWYLETPHRQKVGPYSILQLASLLEEGEIHPQQRVFPDKNSQESVQVIRLIESHTDPNSDLLKTLQSIREKQNRSSPHLDPASFPLVQRLGSRIPGQLWLLIALVLILGAGAWGIWTLLQSNTQ